MRVAADRLRSADASVDNSQLYHEALVAYGKAGALYLALSYDTMPTDTRPTHR